MVFSSFFAQVQFLKFSSTQFLISLIQKGPNLKILARGGLGNQLFQFCFIHGYAGKYKKIEVEIIPDPSAAIDRPFELRPLLNYCNHVTLGGTNSSHSNHKFKLRLIRIRERIFFRRFTNLIPVLDKMELHEKTPFVFSTPKWRLANIELPINGYFQHWRFVENVWPAIEGELNGVISHFLRGIKSRKILDEEYIILHIRGGDYLPLSDIFGVLSPSYYLKALKYVEKIITNKFRIIVITNDVYFAKEFMQIVGVSDFEILDPENFTPWETLAILSAATVVVSANSTFSWWGGYVCMKNGGICIMPETWYKNFGKNSSTALRHPNFVTIKDSFN